MFMAGQQMLVQVGMAPQAPAAAPEQPVVPPRPDELGRQIVEEALKDETFEPPPVPLKSRGSALHGTGRCNPCAWYYKPKGCQNMANCSYCHVCPEGELK